MDKNKQKTYKGEKYIYLLMGYTLAKLNNGRVTIGKDTGFKGGQHFERCFSIQDYEGQILLNEIKTSKGFADFTRTFLILSPSAINPTIKDYMNEYNENCGVNWIH